MENFIYFFMIVLLVFTNVGGQIIIMTIISASVITLLDSQQVTSFRADLRKDALLGVLLLGLIMMGLLRTILFHSTR